MGKNRDYRNSDEFEYDDEKEIFNQTEDVVVSTEPISTPTTEPQDPIPENQEQKSQNYGISVDFTKRVKEKCGSIVCKEMLNADLTTEEGKAKIAEKNLFKTLCPKIIADVVEILEEVISENSGE